AAFPSFDPTLASSLPAGTLAYLGLGRPGGAVAALIRQASTEEPGLATAVTRVLSRARKAAGVRVSADLLAALGAEGALALEPRPPGAAGATGTPYLLYLGEGTDPAKTRAALARLEVPVARALSPSAGGGKGGFRTKSV